MVFHILARSSNLSDLTFLTLFSPYNLIQGSERDNFVHTLSSSYKDVTFHRTVRLVETLLSVINIVGLIIGTDYEVCNSGCKRY